MADLGMVCIGFLVICLLLGFIAAGAQHIQREAQRSAFIGGLQTVDLVEFEEVVEEDEAPLPPGEWSRDTDTTNGPPYLVFTDGGQQKMVRKGSPLYEAIVHGFRR